MKPLLGDASASMTVYLGKSVVYFAACWVFGIILAELVEYPALRLRDKLWPAKTERLRQ